MNLLLAVDVGNTSTKIGLYQDEKLPSRWRVATHPVRTSDEISILLNELLASLGMTLDQVEQIAISSVVPQVTMALLAFCQGHLKMDPFLISGDTPTKLTVGYHDPSQLGSDRLVAALAAYERYGAPIIVVNLGTATTVDVVSAQGEFLGGAIAPGITISVEALVERAARLFSVPLEPPGQVIGRNTTQGLQSGIWFGLIGQINGLLSKVREELGDQAEAVVTGGLAETVGPQLEGVRAIDPDLTLEGIRLAWLHNREAGR